MDYVSSFLSQAKSRSANMLIDIRYLLQQLTMVVSTYKSQGCKKKLILRQVFVFSDMTLHGLLQVMQWLKYKLVLVNYKLFFCLNTS